MGNPYRGPSIDASYQFRLIWQSGFREDFQKSTNQKQELPLAAMFVNGSGENEQSLQRIFHRCFLLSFVSFGQAVTEEKIFRNGPIRNKNCLWWPCLLRNREDMSNFYRGPSIDASYQVSDHLTKRLQRKLFRNRPIRNKNCLWQTYLLTDRDEICNLYRGLPQMLPTKFRIIWPSGFRGEDFF